MDNSINLLKNTNWEEVCEKDWYKLRRKGVRPFLILVDEHNNHYYYFDKDKLKNN